MIKVENASKSYDKNYPVFEQINLTFPDAGIYGLIGENGAGKTTLLKCLAGIYRLEQGSITYDGRSVFDSPSVKATIALVSDELGMLGDSSVKSLMEIYRACYPDFDREVFDQLLDTFQIGKNDWINRISKGQRAKLRIAYALAQKPRYLLLDEPTLGLDIMSKALFYDTLVSFMEKWDMTVIISTHDLSELSKICDSYAVIKGRRLLGCGSVEELAKAYCCVSFSMEEASAAALRKQEGILSVLHIGSLYEVKARLNREEMTALLSSYGVSQTAFHPLSLEDVFTLMNLSEDKKDLKKQTSNKGKEAN